MNAMSDDIVSVEPDISGVQLKAFLDWFKATSPCADCGGFFDPWCMDFDHVRGVKVAQVGACIRRGVWALWAEMGKCDVVCALCHRQRTKSRGMTAEQKRKVGQKSKGNRHGLGYRHSEEAKRRFGEDSKRHWAAMTDEQRALQIRNSAKCRLCGAPDHRAPKCTAAVDGEGT